MSLYTEITDEAGRKFQIKAGYAGFDNWQFKVGDTVPWRIDENLAGRGCLLDGIYIAVPEDGNEPKGLFYWVVIDDHRILGVYEEPNLPAMKARFKIQELPRETWSEEAWARKEKLEQESKRRRDKFDAEFGHLPALSQIAIASRNLIVSAMEKQSLARRILGLADRDEPEKHTTVCRHGILTRQCEICERDDEIKRLRMALEFYALTDHWYDGAVARDAGAIAIEALKE